MLNEIDYVTKCKSWFPLEWTGWISLQSKGRLRVFSIWKSMFLKASFIKCNLLNIKNYKESSV